MVLFTQGIYEARELALSRMQAEATEAQRLWHRGRHRRVCNHVWGEHATEFLATGTAIRRLADEHRLPDDLTQADLHPRARQLIRPGRTWA